MEPQKEIGEEQKGGTCVPPIAERRLPSILVPIIAMVTECTLLLSEFTLFVLNLRLIALQGVGGLLCLFLLVPVSVPMALPERLVHFALLVLELMPMVLLGSAPLVYFFLFMLDPFAIQIGRTPSIVAVPVGVSRAAHGEC
jgi:hypothetical protein